MQEPGGNVNVNARVRLSANENGTFPDGLGLALEESVHESANVRVHGHVHDHESVNDPKELFVSQSGGCNELGTYMVMMSTHCKHPKQVNS